MAPMPAGPVPPRPLVIAEWEALGANPLVACSPPAKPLPSPPANSNRRGEVTHNFRERERAGWAGQCLPRTRRQRLRSGTWAWMRSTELAHPTVP